MQTYLFLGLCPCEELELELDDELVDDDELALNKRKTS